MRARSPFRCWSWVLLVEARTVTVEKVVAAVNAGQARPPPKLYAVRTCTSQCVHTILCVESQPLSTPDLEVTPNPQPGASDAERRPGFHPEHRTGLRRPARIRRAGPHPVAGRTR